MTIAKLNQLVSVLEIGKLNSIDPEIEAFGAINRQPGANIQSCLYCKGENVPGCYCVQRFTFTIPAPHDAHVNAYDRYVINRALIKADPVRTLQIKTALNCYMKPFSEIRRLLQHDN